jgi:hypothetical protein
MTGSTSAGSDGKPDGRADDSAAATGSQGDGGKGSGDMVPKSQFLAALKSAEQKREQEAAMLRGEIEQLRAAVQGTDSTVKKPPTRAELQTLVESGDITQVQADQAWEKQVREEARREGAAAADRVMREQKHMDLIHAELSGYKALVPQVWEPGTEERLKVEKEFNHLVSLGQPKTQETEAAALRAAFGDLDTLRAATSSRPGPADTHSETGGGQRPSGGGGGDGVKGLTAAQRDYYEAGIKAGRYENWAAVKAELEFKPSKSARR